MAFFLVWGWCVNDAFDSTLNQRNFDRNLDVNVGAVVGFHEDLVEHQKRISPPMPPEATWRCPKSATIEIDKWYCLNDRFSMKWWISDQDGEGEWHDIPFNQEELDREFDAGGVEK